MNENPKLQHHRRRRRRVAVAASPSPPQPQPQPFISLPLVPMPQCASTISLPLLSHLPPNADGGDAAPQLLIPGCGNSRLSEHLYDAGYTGLTNIDFSKVVISDMLRRNVRLRPHIRWRVMDMTNMQLEDESFDAIIDKGGLDALMEPELGPKLGNQYLSEELVSSINKDEPPSERKIAKLCEYAAKNPFRIPKARQAYLIGNKALAKELSAKGQVHNMHMKAAHGKAQESIYRQRNPVAPEMQGNGRGQERMIDLHGLHVSEAIHVLKHELSVLKNTARAADQPLQVYICVGTGHHTRGSRTPARLPIAVQRFLLEEGLDFTEPQPGLLRVVIY